MVSKREKRYKIKRWLFIAECLKKKKKPCIFDQKWHLKEEEEASDDLKGACFPVRKSKFIEQALSLTVPWCFHAFKTQASAS